MIKSLKKELMELIYIGIDIVKKLPVFVAGDLGMNKIFSFQKKLDVFLKRDLGKRN